MPYRTPLAMEAQKEARRQQIMEAATRVFADKGYRATTIRDIVEAAGVSVGSFYFYFASKVDLFETLYGQLNDQFLSILGRAAVELERDPCSGLTAAVARTMRLMNERRAASRLLIAHSSGIHPDFERKRLENNKRFYTILVHLLEGLTQSGLIQCDNANLAARSLMGGLYNTCLGYLEGQEGNLSMADFVYAACVYHLRGLGLAFEPARVQATTEQVLREE